MERGGLQIRRAPSSKEVTKKHSKLKSNLFSKIRAMGVPDPLLFKMFFVLVCLFWFLRQGFTV